MDIFFSGKLNEYNNMVQVMASTLQVEQPVSVRKVIVKMQQLAGGPDAAPSVQLRKAIENVSWKLNNFSGVRYADFTDFSSLSP